MKYYTYILFSKKINKYYIGYTSDIEKRIEKHNLGGSTFTKKGIPWELVYFKTFDSKKEALKREKEIKNKKSRKYIEFLISSNS